MNEWLLKPKRGEEYYILHSRQDQLASCFLHNICEVLYSLKKGWRPVVAACEHLYLNKPRSATEPISDIYAPFRSNFPAVSEAAAKRLSSHEAWTKIDDAAVAAVLSWDTDVISAYRDQLQRRVPEFYDPERPKPQRSRTRPSKESRLRASTNGSKLLPETIIRQIVYKSVVLARLHDCLHQHVRYLVDANMRKFGGWRKKDTSERNCQKR